MTVDKNKWLFSVYNKWSEFYSGSQSRRSSSCSCPADDEILNDIQWEQNTSESHQSGYHNIKRKTKPKCFYTRGHSKFRGDYYFMLLFYLYLIFFIYKDNTL